MITLRIKDGEETLVRMMGVYVTVQRDLTRKNQYTVNLRYHPDTKAAIPGNTVDRKPVMQENGR